MDFRRVALISLALVFPALRLGAGGPDEGGYRWSDSDTSGGPSFQWAEISSLGTQVVMGDDDNCGPFPLGWSFTYYGVPYDSLRICSNGWLSFTSESHQFHPFEIPGPEEPNALLAPFWFDLDPSSGGAIYYYPDTARSRFVVAWYGVPPFGGSGGYTFQAILNQDGAILFQYKRMQSSAGVDSASVGIEDGDGLLGLQYFYKGFPIQNLLHDSLAVKFYQLDHDVRPIQIHSPLERVFPSLDLVPRVTVKNYGKNQETFTVECQISDSSTGGVVYEDSAWVNALPSLAEAFVQFPSAWVPEQGTYAVSFATLLSGDQDPSNDTLQRYTTCSYRAELAYDDGEADCFRYLGGSPTVHWALAVRFTPPFSPFRVLAGRVLAEDVSPFEEIMVCPDSGGVPDVHHPYDREELVSAPSPFDWACASFDTTVRSLDDIWLVAVWPLASVSPRVGEDTDPPVDCRSYYGVPGIYWNPWAAGDWIMRIEIDGTTGVEELRDAGCKMPDARLMQNSPNPFTRTTTIRYHVSADGRPRTAVCLAVYDLSGRLVIALVKAEEEPGLHSVIWDGRDRSGSRVPPGIYFCRLTYGFNQAGSTPGCLEKKVILFR